MNSHLCSPARTSDGASFGNCAKASTSATAFFALVEPTQKQKILQRQAILVTDPRNLFYRQSLVKALIGGVVNHDYAV